MAARGGKGRKKRGAHGGDHADERWLLTYADMLTLMFALFMVLFSISSVNISKYQVLQRSLKAAFSGSVLPGGRSILKAGSISTSAHSPATAAVPAIVPLQPQQATHGQSTSQSPNPYHSVDQQLANAMASAAAGNREQADFQALRAKLNAFAIKHGFANQVQATIGRDGLHIDILTDKLLFDSGQATIKPVALPLLDEVAKLLNVDRTHPITVAGHTDNQPIATIEFPNNWVLSEARATSVVLFLIAHSVDGQRLAASGYADLHPLASNATAHGRAKNRRVEIILQRLNPFPSP
jgi:chemotaxis protein MotB